MNKLLAGILILVMAGGAGCASHRQVVHTSCLSGQARGIIFAVDGAGGFLATSKAVTQVVAEDHLSMEVVPVEWSHGYGRFVADQVCWTYTQECGCKLAQEITAYHQSFPQAKIFLIAHSAGSGVAITAAEALPPDSIDRIVLLSPSVSSDYDLRPALRAAREGVDVFYSRRDVAQLGVGIALLGTVDRCWGCAAAGRVGFQPQVQCPEDSVLYGKLRQHPWDPALAWTGNRGGHEGSRQPDFLRAFVLPLLLDSPCRVDVGGNL
jgi:pimeloyl-ACP methyl ester carboxylesterase